MPLGKVSLLWMAKNLTYNLSIWSHWRPQWRSKKSLLLFASFNIADPSRACLSWWPSVWPDGYNYFFIFGHLQRMKICLIWFKFLPSTKLSIENCQKTLNTKPKWRNFAKSGHTGDHQRPIFDHVLKYNLICDDGCWEQNTHHWGKHGAL